MFAEVRDHDTSNSNEIVDRFFIDRDDVELGVGFSAAQFYNGSFGWGHISLTLRVNCAEGFSGEDCNIGKTGTASVGRVYDVIIKRSHMHADLDPCAHTMPCQNGGTCTTPGPDQFECQCVEGYEGVNCEDETDECNPNPCLNEGTCIVSNTLRRFTLYLKPSGIHVWCNSCSRASLSCRVNVTKKTKNMSSDA